jgi:RNA polymerase sigma factor (sigma-70 family)
VPGQPLTIDEQNRFIADTMQRDQTRLRQFIRRRVLDSGDAEDILQDVFYELTSTYRLMKPIEQVTAWMYRIAANRITDRFRRRKTVSLQQPISDDDDASSLEDLLPSPDAGPDALYARSLMLDALTEAIDELPANQREVFVAHEFLGRSFKELAEESGTPINTLLSRKRYAVLQLRERLQQFSDFKDTDTN